MSARAILTGLQPNAAYVVRVRHRNVVGWGQLSAPARVHTSVPPAAPKVSAVESTASTVALLAPPSWLSSFRESNFMVWAAGCWLT